MRPPQPAPTASLHTLAIAQAAELAAVYDGDAHAAARAGLRQAQQDGDPDSVALWSAVCAIFEGSQRVDL